MASISVVIPAYNRADWLPVTVASVLDQSVAPLEVLIVDDGSTDDTPHVCARFLAPVRYLRQENAGVSAARNHGIRESRGDYIALIDSDDLWAPDKLELQLRALEMTGAQWCATGVSLIDPEGRTVEADAFTQVFALFNTFGFEPDDFFGRWLSTSTLTWANATHTIYTGDAFGPLFFGNFIAPSSVLIGRSAFEKTGYFDENLRLAEETEFFHRVAAQVPIALIRTPLTHYRAGHPGSLVSGTNTVTLAQNALRSLNRAAALRPQLPPVIVGAYHSGREALELRLAYAHLATVRPAECRAALLQARRQGLRLSARWVGLFVASHLPRSILRAMHFLKRHIRGSRVV